MQLNSLVLSTFTGAGLLDMAFREIGFCVVSAGDIITGQDIQDFKGIKGRFNGIIGGSPCQDFSILRRTPPTGNGLKMMGEFKRIVLECQPDWFLLENVPQVPDLIIDGYYVQRFNLNATECGSPQNRNRRFQFGSVKGWVLNIERERALPNISRCVTASEGNQIDRRTWGDFCELQGLPRNYHLPSFTQTASYRAVGNGVPLPMGRKVAAAIRDAAHYGNARTITDFKACLCGCGREVSENRKTANDACRKRLQKQRERATVTKPGGVTPELSQF